MNDSNHGNKIGEVIFLIILLYVFAPAMLVMGTYGLIIGLLIGFVGLEFVTSRINKFQLLISEKYNIYLNDDEWFTRWFLYPPYSIANRSFQLADKIQYPTLRTGVKFALVVDSILFVVYMIILWFILSLLGSALSDGFSSGGSSSGNRPSSPMHETYRTEKSYYTGDTILKDKNGKRVGTVSKTVYDDRQIIQDANGKYAGDLRTTVWDDDRQIIRDSSGEHAGDIKTNIFTGKREIRK